MEPIIYDPSPMPTWYTNLPDREKMCCQLSQDNTLNYVRYVMCQATGYKLTSNKELPAKNLPWLMEYYPVATQVENATTNTATVTVNTAQSFPHYIIWNIGSGNETENPASPLGNSRDRIKGLSYKLQKTGVSSSWAYKYNVPLSYTGLTRVGGNGSVNANNNIIIEKTL